MSLEELYEAETEAFYAYGRALRGDDGISRHSAISPARVRARRDEWHAALAALRAAGGTVQGIRVMLRGES